MLIKAWLVSDQMWHKLIRSTGLCPWHTHYANKTVSLATNVARSCSIGSISMSPHSSRGLADCVGSGPLTRLHRTPVTFDWVIFSSEAIWARRRALVIGSIYRLQCAQHRHQVHIGCAVSRNFSIKWNKPFSAFWCGCSFARAFRKPLLFRYCNIK